MDTSKVTFEGMCRVMLARGWHKTEVWTVPGGATYVEWDHSTLPADRTSLFFRAPNVPTLDCADGSDSQRVRDWAETVANRSENATPAQILAEAESMSLL